MKQEGKSNTNSIQQSLHRKKWHMILREISEISDGRNTSNKIHVLAREGV